MTRLGWFNCWQELGLFLLATASRPALRPTVSSPMGSRGSFPEVKKLVHEADHSPPSRTDVKTAWSYTSTPPVCFHGVLINSAQDVFIAQHLVKNRDNFTLFNGCS
jgi:hypothetical protein